MSSPSNSTRPPDFGTSPDNASSVVDLPAPFAPTSDVIAFASIVRSIPRTASIWP